MTALHELSHGTIELTGQAVRVLGYYDGVKDGDNEELRPYGIWSLRVPLAVGKQISVLSRSPDKYASQGFLFQPSTKTRLQQRGSQLNTGRLRPFGGYRR